MNDAQVISQLDLLLRERLAIEVLAADTDVIESGLLDSLALVTLIAAIEDVFHCELPLDDFDLDRFRSLERIATYLGSLGILGAR